MPSVRDAVEPVPVDVGGALHQPRLARSRLRAPPRPAASSWTSWARRSPPARRSARRDRLHRLLAVGGGVADVLRLRGPCDRREAAAQRRDDARPCRRPTASSGWRRRGCADRRTSSVSASATSSTSSTAPGGQLAHGADHLGMAGMADQQHRAARVVMALGLAMHLGDQRAGGVDDRAACGGAASAGTALGTPCAENTTGRSSGTSSSSSTKTAPLASQALDDVAVVDDLVADIDRRAVALERALDDLDGAVDAGAEAARAGEQDRERLLGGLMRNVRCPLACGLRTIA